MEGRGLVVGYWPGRFRVEQVRLLLEYLNVPYSTKTYTTPEEWQRDKQTLNHPFANLPYIKDGDTVVCETDAIIHYICTKAEREDLLGRTQKQVLQQRTLRAAIDDSLDGILRSTKPGEAATYIKDKVLPRLEKIGTSILTPQKTVLDDLTIVDFKLVALLDLLKATNPQILASGSLAMLQEVQKTVEAIPQIAAFRKVQQAGGKQLWLPPGHGLNV